MNEILVDEEGYNQFLNELEKAKEKWIDITRQGGEACKDAVGDGWHDNFAYEDAMREERKMFSIIKKMTEEQKHLKKISKPEKLSKNKVNINDLINIKVIYDDCDEEEIVVKLTGKYISEDQDDIEEITLNSPLGKAIYLKKIPSNVFYYVDDKQIQVQIISKK